MMQLDYYNFEGFENIFLEDSFVLKINCGFDEAEFFMEAVLTENHPLYMHPKQNEQYCYRKAKIDFPMATKIIWIEKNLTPYTDADGEIDFGNIDSFFYDGSYYNLYGDWGELKIQSAKLTIEFIED